MRLCLAALADPENKDHNDRNQHHSRRNHQYDIVCDECLKGGDGTLHVLGGEQVDGAQIQIIIFYAEGSEHIALFDRRFHLVDAGDLGVQQAFVVIIREISGYCLFGYCAQLLAAADIFDIDGGEAVGRAEQTHKYLAPSLSAEVTRHLPASSR